MRIVEWRAADTSDTHALADLFAASEAITPVGLETAAEQVRSRLQHPGLDLTRYTLIGVGSDGRAAAYAEVCDMGMATDVLRIRLTYAVLPELSSFYPCDWAMNKADHLRRERAPQHDAVLGTRCGDRDRSYLTHLTDAGFELAWRKIDMVRDLRIPIPAAPPPPEFVLTPFATCYDEPTRQAHNDAYAASPSAALPDRESWPQHATGLSSFLADASFLALTRDEEVAAFALALRDSDEKHRPGAVLECLGTRPAWRRRGLATVLITQALRECAAMALPRARLRVDSTNPTAIALYSKLQFTDTGRGYTVLTRRLRHETA